MPVKKKAVKPAVVAEKKPPTKTQLLSILAEQTGFTRADVSLVLEALNGQIKRNLSKRTGSGMFSIPGLIKVRVVRKPRTKARKGVNPFTGEQIMIAAKPARNAVKLQALKGLKDMI